MTRPARRRRRAQLASEPNLSDPQAARPAEPMGEVRSVRGFATWLKISLYGYSLLSLASIFISVLAIMFFAEVQNGVFNDGLRDPEAEGTRIDQMFILVNGTLLIALLSSALAYGFFFQRALKNLQAVHQADPDMRPFGVWAWYFVPFANLVKPLDGFNAVRDGSRYAEGKKSDGSGLVALWWFCWLGFNIASRIGQVMLESGMESGDVDTLSLASLIDAGATAIGLIAALLLARFVTEITRGQEQAEFMSNASAFD